MIRYCPTCGSEMQHDEMNAVSDIAKCNECGTIHTLQELLYEPPRKQNIFEVPEGSEFNVSKGLDGSLELYLPPKGFHWFHLFIIPFVIFWVGFVAFWTVMASRGSYFFALFSIPFWYTGFAMVRGIYSSITGWFRIQVNRKELIIEKATPLFSKTKKILLPDIKSIQLEHYKSTIQNKKSVKESFQEIEHSLSSMTNRHSLVPTVRTGKETFTFLGSASTEEQNWVVELLNILVLKLT